MAQFENKSVEEIRDLILNSMKSKFNLVFRLLSKSFLFVLATILGGIFVICYKQIGWFFLQLFPEHAYWKTVHVLGLPIRPLVKWGILIGVGEPRQGTQWKGEINISTIGYDTSLIAGTQLKSDLTGSVYLTEKSITLENENEVVPVICTDVGNTGNLENGDILKFVSPLGNVQKEAKVLRVTVYGRDNESESEYRTRVVNRFRNPPLGGALADYRQWASDEIGRAHV